MVSTALQADEEGTALSSVDVRFAADDRAADGCELGAVKCRGLSEAGLVSAVRRRLQGEHGGGDLVGGGVGEGGAHVVEDE